MSESQQAVRQRKKRHGKSSTNASELEKTHRAKPQSESGDHAGTENAETAESHQILLSFLRAISFIIGVVVMVIVSYKYCVLIHNIHENNMWFTNIKEVEREISFRTESGLYYSYYKQLVQTPGGGRQGVIDLTQDKKTEHLNTINILARFNVYQEVVLAALYRNLPDIQRSLEPIFFYTNSIFGLQSVLIVGLYCLAWLMSGTWLAGLLAVCFYVANRTDTTRVDFVVPLRESFSLPFLWAQLALITYYFRCDISGFARVLSVAGIYMCTFLFAITWQFNQFVLLLQAMALFGVQVLHMAPHDKIRVIYMTQAVSMLVVCFLQYRNPMIIGSMLLSFIPAALLVMRLQGQMPLQGNIAMKALKTFAFICLVFTIAIPLNTVIKKIISLEADEHIFKFLVAKFGLGNSRDFDANLYLCNGAFTFLEPHTFVRLTENLVFPIYALVHVGLLLLLAGALLQQWRFEDNKGNRKESDHVFAKRPALAYHAIQCTFFGVLAITTLRMKYLWTPYMCVLASAGLGDSHLWHWLTGKLAGPGKVKAKFCQYLILAMTLAAVVYKCLPPLLAELEDLREFYDPDTVELMEWIKAKTPATAAFTGSMQLLAGVKLCTGRPVTNHPHYEDMGLRHRTKELYQMYARREPSDVYKIMKKYDASYVILEDSICHSPAQDGCRLPDILDIDNGMVTDFGEKEPGLVRSTVPRFCDQVRHQRPEYATYFKAVFKNKTFRIYKVL